MLAAEITSGFFPIKTHATVTISVCLALPFLENVILTEFSTREFKDASKEVNLKFTLLKVLEHTIVALKLFIQFVFSC